MFEEEKIKKLVSHFGYAEKNLYTWKELEWLLNLRPFVNNDRFTPAIISPDYDWFYTGWSTDHNTWPVSCIKDTLSKTTAYIRDCSKVSEKINSTCYSLEKILKKNVDCHIYISLNKDVQNFEKHKDGAHNIIVVTEGSIKCEIWIEGGHIIEKELTNGEYAFVPAHVYHRITPITEKRLSLSFPIALDEPVGYEEREWLRLDNLD